MFLSSLEDTILFLSMTSSVIPLLLRNLRPLSEILFILVLDGFVYCFIGLVYCSIFLTVPLYPHLWQLYTPIKVLIDKHVSFQFSLPIDLHLGHLTFCSSLFPFGSMPKSKNSCINIWWSRFYFVFFTII